MASVIIHSHPAEGHTGQPRTAEYTETEWASGDCGAAYDPLTRDCLDKGQRVQIGDRIHVNPIAFYRRFIGCNGPDGAAQPDDRPMPIHFIGQGVPA